MKLIAKLLRVFGSNQIPVFLTFLFTSLLSLSSHADSEWKDPRYTGFLEAQARYFFTDPSFDKQLSDDQLSIASEFELHTRTDDRTEQFKFIGFGRLDSKDSERTHFDIRELYYQTKISSLEILAGINRVFWGVTESRHLVNIVNQVDFVESIDEEDFLGQPMLQISKQTNLGRFQGIVLPYFRERLFPGSKGRFRNQLVINNDDSLYESSAGQNRVDTALRYSHYFGDFDIGVYVFRGISREPNLIVSENGDRLIPHYPTITQTGVDAQYTNEEWLWKLEAVSRLGQGSRFEAYVAGLEYTYFQFLDTDMDFGVLVEGLYDGREELTTIDSPNNSEVQRQGLVFPTINDEEIFVGGRLAWNDTQDTTALAGIFYDLDNGWNTIRLEASRRLGEDFTIELEAQVFLESEADDVSSFFRNDDFLSLNLSRHF